MLHPIRRFAASACRVVAVAALLVSPRPAAAQAGYEGTVTSVQANVRRAPSLQSPVVRTLPQGTRLPVLGKERGWYRVQLPDSTHESGPAFLHESTVHVVAVSSPTADGLRTGLSPTVAPARHALDPTGALRDPARARMLSYFVPGGGHLYSGEYERGLAHLVGGIGGLLAGDALSRHYSAQRRDLENPELGAVVDCVGDVISSFFCNHPDVPRYLGIAVLGVSWLAGIADAPESAHRMNEKRGLQIRTSAATIMPLLVLGADGRPEVGVTLARN